MPPVLIWVKLPQLTGMGVIERVSVRVLVDVRVLVPARVFVRVRVLVLDAVGVSVAAGAHPESARVGTWRSVKSHNPNCP